MQRQLQCLQQYQCVEIFVLSTIRRLLTAKASPPTAPMLSTISRSLTDQHSDASSTSSRSLTDQHGDASSAATPPAEAANDVTPTQVTPTRRGPGRPLGARSRRTDQMAAWYIAKNGGRDPLERGIEVAGLPILAPGVLEGLAERIRATRHDAAKFWLSALGVTLPFAHQRLASLEVRPPGAPGSGEPVYWAITEEGLALIDESAAANDVTPTQTKPTQRHERGPCMNLETSIFMFVHTLMPAGERAYSATQVARNRGSAPPLSDPRTRSRR